MSRFAQLVLATNNAKKLTELRRLVAEAGLEVEILGLADFPSYPDPVETERSFEGNALLKAQAAAEHTGIAAIADDSGLEVEELNYMPGVRSARWAGPACDDTANNELLLAQLTDVPVERRAARFVCALAMVTAAGETELWRGEMPGRIAIEPAGGNGFGYDPIFIPEGWQQTSAQASAAEKDAISHRGKAVREFLDWLKEN